MRLSDLHARMAEFSVTGSIAREVNNLHHYCVPHNGIKIHDQPSDGGQMDAGHNCNDCVFVPIIPSMVGLIARKNKKMNLSNAIIVYK
jgi:hypothetical protein